MFVSCTAQIFIFRLRGPKVQLIISVQFILRRSRQENAAASSFNGKLALLLLLFTLVTTKITAESGLANVPG
jgi:hypothetical protein